MTCRLRLIMFLLTGPGPYYATLTEFEFDKARRDVEAHLLLPMQVARKRPAKPVLI